ncbi:NAD(P)H-binding protein [Streptomyces sp. LE64]|uniref:NAD(P)H-binding protein n=1 Tax=Streptomyces sp. LE64 TaxID=3448653 RepID=UPI00404343E8
MTTHSGTDRPVPSAPVLVLGGTGKTGRRVSAALARRGFAARPASRSAATRFDWSDRTTWGPALDGVRAVYVVDSQGPDAAEEVRAFAALAAETGVRRLVLLSARTWGEFDDPALLATEDAVRAAGPDWTILRPTWFDQNFTEEWFLSSVLTTGELRVPAGEGREPFLDLEDLAEVAAVTLTEDGHAGRTYELSGPRALTLREAVAELSAAAGRPLRYVPVSEAEYLAEQRAAGVPEEVAQLLAGLFRHIAEDGSASIADGVRQVLGRDPRDFRAYARGADLSADPAG